MSSSQYSYDEESTHAPFFILTLAGVFAIPLTYNILKSSPELENTGTKIESDYKPKDEEIILAQKRTQKRKERKTKRIICACILWGLIAYAVYLIAVTQRTVPQLWDPYDVLGISTSASEKQIDRHYKRLAIKFHPDKAQPDPAKNETLDDINDRWVEMTKAYKTLTDEEARENYRLYGNPDGKQSTSVGIAIPQWLVQEGNRWIVIAFYALLLGVFLPYVVGSWWYGTQALTKEKILHSSAGKLFTEYTEDIDEAGVINALSAGDEYSDLLKGKVDAGAAKIESAVLASGILSDKQIQRLKSIEEPVRRKALCLLWAYLGRIDLGDDELNRQKYAVAPTALLLNQSFSSITLPFLIAEPLYNSYKTSQHLIQAVPPSGSPATQLPYITDVMVKSVSGANSKSPLTVQKLMSLPSSIRRSLLSGLNDEQYKQAVLVASQIPHLQVAKAFFKVTGDRVVTQGSLVQLVVKARVIPPGTPAAAIPAIKPEDLEDPDPEEGDIDAIKGRPSKKAKGHRRRNSEGKVIESITEVDNKPVQPSLAHAPFFPADHAPRWHIFLSESRSGRVAVPPFTFTTFDKPIFTANGKPTFNVVTLRCQFQAPPQVHAFAFTMHLICDSYIGMDSKVDVVLDVRDASEATEKVVEDDISEPDEDSLAGQLQAMKTGNAPPPSKKKAKKTSEDSDEDEESDTEGEADDTSETDTETEDEDD